MYLLWQDLDTKKSQAMKASEAIAAYRDRFRTSPNVILMNEVELIDIPGMQVRSAGHIRRNILWVGWEDSAGKASHLAASDGPPR